MKKKLLALVLCFVMVTATLCIIAACTDPEDDIDAKYKYDITVWVGEDTKALTEQLIDEFNKTNTQSIYFKAKVNEMTESAASGDVLAKPASAPEIFCFAQDQIARLVNAKLLAAPGASAVLNINATHSDTAVAAATVGDTVYAYPLTEDNGYFMYYDKSVIDESKIGSLEDLIAICEANNRYFSMNLEGGWYVASFFYATDSQGNSLCHSEWTVDAQGKFTDYDDTFNSANGMIAAKGMQKLLQSTRYLKNGKASDFNASTKAAVVVSGIWDYQTAKNALGNNLGIAKLPSYTVDGQSYQLQSYLGSKLLGVTPQTDAVKAGALSLLAQYLTNEHSQMVRFEKVGWGPSVKTAQANDTVKNNIALAALMASAKVPQGQYPANWWAKAQTLSGNIQTAKSDTALQGALSTYSDSLDALLND